MARSTVSLTVLVAALLLTSVASAAQSTFDRRLSAPPGGHLTFTTAVGSVTVIGRPAQQVIVHAELQGSKSFLARVHIRTEQTSSGVTIRAHVASGGWFHGFDVGRHRVRFLVQVPRGYPVNLRTSGGHLTVRSVNAAVRAGTSGGSAVVQDVSGPLALYSSGGSIAAQHIDGPIHLSSSGGAIRVVDSTGELRLRSAGGGIRLRHDEGQIRAYSSGGDIRAQLLENQGIDISTGGGDIDLRLPQNTRGSIQARSDGGRITCEFPLSTVQLVAGHHLVATLGGGGPSIFLQSSGGAIRIGPHS